MTTTADYRYGVDWRRKGFLCWGARPGDALNLIPSPLMWETIRYATSTSLTFEKLAVSVDCGTHQIKWSTGTSLYGYFQLTSVGFDSDYIYVPAQPLTTYTFSVYVSSLADYNDIGLGLWAIDNNLDSWGTADIDAFHTTTNWVKHSLAFTTTATTSGLYFRVDLRSVSAVSRTVNLTGFSLNTGSTAPTGFNTGSTVDLYDNLTPYVKSAKWDVGFKKPFTDIADEMTCNLVLDNTTRAFSPENPSSPFYGDNWLSRPVTVQATYSGATTTLWKGWTDDIQPAPMVIGPQTTTVSAKGAKQYLQRAEAETPMMLNVTTDTAIGTLLDLVKFPVGYANGPWALGVPGFSELGSTTVIRNCKIARSLGVGRHTFPYVGDTWSENKIKARGFERLEENKRPRSTDVYGAISQLVAAERGRFFFRRDGTAIFWNRHHLLSDFTDDDTLTNESTDMDYSYGSYLTSHVKVTYYPRVVGSREILWTLDEAFDIRKGKEKTIRARFVDPDTMAKVAAIEVEKPSTVNSSLLVSSSHVKLISFKANSTGATLTFKSTRNGTVNAITIYGQKITSFNSATVTQNTRGVGFLNGYREFNLDLDLLDDENIAESLARYEASRRGRAKGNIESLTFVGNKSTATMMRAMTRTIGDRISVTDTQTGHTGSYFIVGEQHSVDAGLLHRITWVLEPANTTAFWLLGRAGYSELGSTTRVAPL